MTNFHESSMPPEKEQSPAEKLAVFKAEIAQYRQDELDNKRTSKHLIDDGFNVDQLTEEDMAIWKKIKDESITFEEMRDFSAQPASPDLSFTRQKFIAFMSNISSTPLIKRQLAEARKNRNKSTQS